MTRSESAVRWASFGASMTNLLALLLSFGDFDRNSDNGAFMVLLAVGIVGAVVSLTRGFWLLVPVGFWFVLYGAAARTQPYHPTWSFWFVTAGLWLVAAPFVRKRLG